MTKGVNEPGSKWAYQDPDNSSLPGGDDAGEDIAFLEGNTALRDTQNQQRWRISARVCTILNICLTVVLIGLWLFMYNSKQCWGPPGPIRSPVREDGFVHWITQRMYPQKIFQSETSDEVERAWNKTMGSSEGIVQIPKSRAEGLPRSVGSFDKEDHYIYGLAVYHELHCLNRIRKTFYADKFFPHEAKEEIDFHKNHCFDVLRQALMCNADVALIPWWNTTWTYTDNQGREQYTEEYLSMTNLQRAESSYVIWDLETKCIDMDALEDWVIRN